MAEPMIPWDVAQIEALRAALLRWYEANKRDLSWRKTRDPYAIWVSEVMLQQTQVITVEAYYQRWMARFPSVTALANAPLEDVLSMWSGLGYYRRARSLHQAAQQVVAEHGGALPADVNALRALPGIGAYTAGAIASIAFGLPAPLVDGNVERILARWFCVEDDPKAGPQQRRFWALAEALLDRADPGAFNQALMELGATVCTPKQPACLLCPVRAHCGALLSGEDVTQYPGKVKRAASKAIDAACVIAITPDAQVLLWRRPEQGLLAQMVSWPALEPLPASLTPERAHEALREALSQWLDGAPEVTLHYVGELTHVFTHRRMTLGVYVTKLDAPAPTRAERMWWAPAATLEEVGCAALTLKAWAMAKLTATSL